MQRFFVLIGVGVWSLAVVAVVMAADNKRQRTPDPVPVTPSSGPQTYTPQPGVNPRIQAAEFQRAQAAAAAAREAAARQAAADRARRAAEYQRRMYDRSRDPYGYPPYYGYNNGYSPYGYIPYGTTPYVLGIGPNGSAYLYPYNGYSGYYGNPYGYGYSNPYSAPYSYQPYGYGNFGYMTYPPMVFGDASQLYGLGPIQRMMGVEQWFNPGAARGNVQGGNNNPNPNAGFARDAGAGNDRPRPAADPPAPKADRGVGGKPLELAWKFIGFGDAHFGNQKYNDALDRYRLAARECPRLADVWFRQGFALAAQGKYAQAAKAMRKGLDEKPDWASGGFRLQEIYRDAADEREAKIADMVKAAEAAPTDGDLAFVVGVHLYCDGKAEQAAAFLRRAAQITGDDAAIKGFLSKDL